MQGRIWKMLRRGVHRGEMESCWLTLGGLELLIWGCLEIFLLPADSF